jgi:hypothetical protein
MKHLELVRVHETGEDLVLRAPNGDEFLLSIEEILDAATGGTPPTAPAEAPAPVPEATPSQAKASGAKTSGADDVWRAASVASPGLTPPRATPEAAEAAAADATEADDATQAPAVELKPLSPREIQARIRAGATAQEVAATSSTPLANILRYEGPVLAERDYIARQAGDVEVSAPLGNEGYRAAFGDEPATLAQMVRTRLRAFGADPETLSWDAWKVDAGTWSVVASFVLPEGSAAVGEEPPAVWTFHPARKHLENANRWGQVLSEWEPWDVLPGQRRLVPVGSAEPASFEHEPEDPEAVLGRAEDEALLDVLSRRRGTRVGEDADGDDALAHLIARSHADRDEPGERPGAVPRPWTVPEPVEDPVPDNVLPGPGRTDGLVEPEGSELAWPPLRRVPDPVPASRGLEGDDDDDSPRPHKKRRSQVPSWDEIVFGRSAKGTEDDEDED